MPIEGEEEVERARVEFLCSGHLTPNKSFTSIGQFGQRIVECAGVSGNTSENGRASRRERRKARKASRASRAAQAARKRERERKGRCGVAGPNAYVGTAMHAG